MKLTIDYDAAKGVASFFEANDSKGKALFSTYVSFKEFECLVEILTLIENSSLSSLSLAFVRQYVTELNVRTPLQKKVCNFNPPQAEK